MKILLVRLDHIGDLLLTTPLVRALARGGHEVELVVPRALLPLLEANPHVRAAFAVEDIAPAFPALWRPLRDWMRARLYDTILLPNAHPRALLRCSFGSGARRRLAMQAGILGRLTSHRCLRIGPAMEGGRHYSDLLLDFARLLGVEPDGLQLDYVCRPEEIAAARRNLALRFPDRGAAPLIALHPGHAGNTCNLPSRVYGELAQILLERSDAHLVVTGSAAESALLDSWPSGVLASPRVENAVGALDLRRLAAILRAMDAVVAVGTGPLHLAAALRVPTLSPFCALPPLSPAVWGNVSGPAICLEPATENCRRWRKTHPPGVHCDFRGEITADQLWLRLLPLLKSRPASS